MGAAASGENPKFEAPNPKFKARMTEALSPAPPVLNLGFGALEFVSNFGFRIWNLSYGGHLAQMERKSVVLR